MTDAEKAEFKQKMDAARAAKAAAAGASAGSPPPASAGATSAAVARKGQKSPRELKLEVENAHLERKVSDLERFVKDLGASAVAAPAATPAAAPVPQSRPAGWDWEAFANNPV